MATGACALAAVGVLAVVDPHEPGRLPPLCPAHALTGLACPACGGIRMAHSLLHGDVHAAAHDNLALLVALPVVLAVLLVRRPVTAGHGPAERGAAWRGAALLTAALAWTVVRNLPGWPLQPQVR